jgi:uncharacterized membrane protein
VGILKITTVIFYIWDKQAASFCQILKITTVIFYIWDKQAASFCQIIKITTVIFYIWDKQAASFCQQVAALVPDLLCYFYLVKNYKFAHISTTTCAREKNKHRFGICRVLEKN